MEPSTTTTTTTIPLICAISGKTPTDPVVTPSGHICSRSLLLSKLTDTSGIDPFDPTKSRTLDESSLISLSLPTTSTTSSTSSTNNVVPPRPPSSTTIPTLLSTLQSEYDAVLLELFDTRRALEETRRELSSALYQNDAAVRVVARLASERDAARESVASWTAEGTKEEENVGQKRRRVEVEAEEVGPKPPPALVEPDSSSTTPPATTPSDTIPPNDLSVLKSKWKILSKSRRKRPPPPISYATKGQLALFTQVDKKSLHKSSAKPGISALVVDVEDDVAVSGGKDKHVVEYSKQENKIKNNVSVGGGEITCMDVMKREEDRMKIIVTGSEDGRVRVFGGVEEYTPVGSVLIDEDADADDEGKRVVGVSIHPTGSHVLATTKKGTVAFLSLSGEAVQKRAVFCEQNKEEEKESAKYSCSRLHPDGLILGVGTEDGKLKIWDLKTQQCAQTLEGHKKTVTSLSFSENGYHVASSSSSGEVLVWDLRKGKIIATLNQKKDENDSTTTIGAVYSVAFDHSGKYLAYGGEKGARITVVKEWDVTALLIGTEEEDGKKKESRITSIAWGKDAMSLVTCCDQERAMKYWGPPPPSSSPAAADGEGGNGGGDDAVKMEEG